MDIHDYTDGLREPRETSPAANAGGYFGRDYLVALQTHYPELVEGADKALHVGVIGKWIRNIDRLGVDAPERLQRLVDRPWTSERSAWVASGAGRDVRHAGVHYAYKGLILLKPAIDLALYSSLIWALQPRTILEFGSLQGGSGLWFADQLDAQCGQGEVHSFELCSRCISPRASHPRLRFHEADLRNIGDLDRDLLARLPHPWLVTDDAHENLDQLVPILAGFMTRGDYYVIEDVFLHHPHRVGRARTKYGAERLADTLDALGFLVDTKYADAYGLNVTASLNGWLVKN